HCAGQSVPAHICDPMAEPDPVDGHGSMPAERGGHEMAGTEGMPSAHEMMGHGGAAGMSVDAMGRGMRNRVLGAAIFSVPILLWSPIGRNVLGFTVAAPFGLRDDVWLLLLSLPVIFYSSWIFFDGAVRALRARTLDMMVLVAVAIGAGWLYSLAVTLTGGGDNFYEAGPGLEGVVMVGCWFGVARRGGGDGGV